MDAVERAAQKLLVEILKVKRTKLFASRVILREISISL